MKRRNKMSLVPGVLCYHSNDVLKWPLRTFSRKVQLENNKGGIFNILSQNGITIVKRHTL
jgi:hypothetical protein